MMFFCAIMITAHLALGQDGKDAVILYNTEPVLAHISKSGDVYRIIREEPDFLKGFTLQIPDYERYLHEKNASSSAVVQKSKDVKEVMPHVYEVNSDLPVANYDVLDFSLGGFSFAESQATLSADAISVLDNIVIYTQTNPNKRIHFNLMKDATNSKRLIKNRSNAILTYLKLRGVDLNDITFLEDNKLSSNYVEFYVVK
ncbi:MAG: hypothetical protein R2774_15890 [Saprospiraceae bacterium]